MREQKPLQISHGLWSIGPIAVTSKIQRLRWAHKISQLQLVAEEERWTKPYCRVKISVATVKVAELRMWSRLSCDRAKLQKHGCGMKEDCGCGVVELNRGCGCEWRMSSQLQPSVKRELTGCGNMHGTEVVYNAHSNKNQYYFKIP
jgi:hypothetical protein